ncbi:molecular chaperone TorD family protein [Campylobacter sp. faydin G-24]|uniref:Molecular chaperone TorD family protein n=1 Tax=Campylobacter anatolicus TaxID=2829105 RepID=A0ABS5HGG7_9BACT|nr:molecular chaperone TorD family protein [Campylobacter anatolicus]MBR8463374.1 molecular chaperone TorD family protein [Campylobacter anatolicus]
MEDQSAILAARKLYYTLFEELFVFSYDGRYKDVQNFLNFIKDSALDEDSTSAANTLILKFSPENIENIIQEYDEIFHAPPNAIHNTFSYYEEGYEAGIACVRVRKLLSKTDVRRDENKFKENEDSIGFVFALMAEFISRQMSGDNVYKDYAKELFVSVINPFIDEFVEILFYHPNAVAYKYVAILLQGFIEFERMFYNERKPVIEKKIKTQDGISRSEAIRREKNRIRRNTERKIDEE